MPTTLVAWLRAQADDALSALLRLRPDLAVPPPADLTVLATRAAVRASVHRACDELDTVALVVLEALIVADADRAPVTRAELAALLGPDLSAARLGRTLERLRTSALVWGPDAELSAVPSLREVVSRHPGGLGRPSAGLAGSSALPDLIADLADDERRVLDALVAGPPYGRSRAGDDPRSAVGRLLGRGLLVRLDAETVELPRQVGLHLRGDRPMGGFAVDPPDIGAREHGPDRVDATAGGAALEVLRRIDALLAFWAHTPPPVLRSGGLGVRELRRAAKEMDTDESDAALLVEVAAAADLVAASDGAQAEWLPTTQSDVWAVGGPEHRWVAVARAWLALPRLPGLVGRRDDAGRVIGALGDGLRRPLAPRERRRVLAGLAELPPGTAPGSTSALVELLAWRAPRRGGRLRDETVGWVVAEATVLGIVALDALSSAGRALLEDPDRVVAALRASLPAPVERVLLQADLTAIAPGPLATDVARELDLMADVESAGGATVYRFTEASVRRALDSGRSATELHELLAHRSATPVPQALTYLVDDIARRHGRLRGGVAASFLRSDDEVLIAEVLVHPAAAELGLRRIAPTVVVADLPLVEVLERLRAAGFSPAAEDSIGAVLDLTDRGRRTAPTRRGPDRTMAELGAEHVTALVSRMRAGDALVGVRRGTPDRTGPTGTIDLLRKAAADQLTVWLGFVDGHGVAGERVLEPITVGGGVLEGRDRVDGALHRVPLHRITSIAVVDDD